MNTEEVPALAQRFRVTAIPTLAVFRAGRELAHQAGAMAAPDICRFVAAAL